MKTVVQSLMMIDRTTNVNERTASGGLTILGPISLGLQAVAY